MKLAPLAMKDLWLSTVNPLRGLTMPRVVCELEAGQRGDFAMLQWLYHFIEKRDATLRGAKRRIRSSILKLDWKVKIRGEIDKADEAKAKKQQQALTAEYRAIKNLKQASAFLALADFRGYSHLEKHFKNGQVVKLQPVPQWHWCRNGLYGEWMFQEDALRGGIAGVPIQPENFLVREVEDPIDEIALICFVRKSLSQKDFDAFIARYGIPFVFWVLSDAMAAALSSDPEKMNEWLSIMRGIGADGEGIIPGGTLETLEARAGSGEQNPFLQHLKYQDEQIVMAATSGKLTMLNEATGLGSGNAEAHSDAFDDIAIALAMEVSETFREQFDAPVLDRMFPGQEHLVYFELAAKDSEDVGQVVKNAAELKRAGYKMDTAELSEKTGYTLTETEDSKTQDGRLEEEEPEPESGKPGAEEEKAEGKNRQTKETPEMKAIRAAAAGLLGGFGDLAGNYLDGDAADLEALFAGAISEPTKDDE
jgi:phage gp29-like protein